MDAIISDIHGNLEALDAVLSAAHACVADRFICLGDIVGYGPNPIECIARLRDFDIVIAGDWDLATISLNDPPWHELLVQQVHWVRSQLAGRESALTFLHSASPSQTIDGKTYFHGTPHDPSEWIFPEDLYNTGKMTRVTEVAGSMSFCGHNHIAGLYRATPRWTYSTAFELGDRWYSLDGTCICSVGSVGQPRDSDPRASFVLCDGMRARFIRIEYNHRLTASKIRATASIPDMHGDRLSYGR